jgi:Mlc titration factor MtfA (ptsG expression regulator)
MDSLNKFFILILLLAFIFFAFLTIKKISKKIKWTEILRLEFPVKFQVVLTESFLPYKYLKDDEKERLHNKILYFLKYKNFIGIGDFEITEEMKLLIAAQACLLIVNLKDEVYPDLYSIYISATTFVEKENHVNPQTMLPNYTPRLGESWHRGPVVLSWSSVRDGVENWRDGYNVVLHEFAHQLDSLDGHMDGTPELDTPSSYKKWEMFMGREFSILRNKVLKHRKSDIDKYGATNEVEFFAVTVEDFFEKSYTFKKNHPELYDLFKDFFKIDPVLWK